MRVRNRCHIAVALVLGLTIISSTAARSQQISVFAADGVAYDSWCNFQTGSGSFYVVYNGGPFPANGEYKAVRFAISLPSYPSVFYLGAWVLGQGDVPVSTLQSGVTVSLGSCHSDAVTLARIDYHVALRPPGCFIIKAVPDPAAPSGKIEFTRCDDVLVYLNEGTISGNIGSAPLCPDGPANPPTNPVPVDSATGVDLDADLFALVHWPNIVLGCFEVYGEETKLYFGTDPNPPLKGDVAFDIFPWDVGHLQPATTYYWKVSYINTQGATGTSPTWSFRTAGPVATEASTWGRVKAMYRD